MAYRRVRNYGYTMGATSGTETPTLPEHPSTCTIRNKLYQLSISALYNNVIHINKERTGKCLRQVEHICGHFDTGIP